MGCFSGEYPCPVEDGFSKLGLETSCAKAFEAPVRQGEVDS